MAARSGDHDEYLFILNHGEQEQLVAVPDWPEAVIGRLGQDSRAAVASCDLAVLRRRARQWASLSSDYPGAAAPVRLIAEITTDLRTAVAEPAQIDR